MTDANGLGTTVDAGPGNRRNIISLSYSCSWDWWGHSECLVCHTLPVPHIAGH